MDSNRYSVAHILAKERHDESRLSKSEAACRCASTTMVNHCSNVFEEPLVRAVIDENHTITVIPRGS